MGDKISSHNQRDGITAKNVNYGGGGAGDRPPKKSFKPWQVIVGAIGLLASLIAIYEFLWK